MSYMPKKRRSDDRYEELYVENNEDALGPVKSYAEVNDGNM